MRKLLFNLDRLTLARPRSARMATMGMPLTHARPTATTDLIILPVEYLLARVHGSTASTEVAASTADGAGTMAVAGTAIVMDSAAKVDGMAAVNFTGTKVFMVTEPSMVVNASAEGTRFTVAAVSMEVVVSMAEAGPTGEATGSC
jgi:hypothetical protein